ncbi:MAG: (2Fe-2S)-binding protein [Rhodobacteraceae bacterium]|nr:(2Fe-2S)-binding protein [Paracoccaceae bacterium]
MIVCSCNVLNDRQLRQAADEMRQDPAGNVPTPGAVFRKLGCRPRCGNCFPNVIQTIHEQASEETETVHETCCQLKVASGG